jgi:Uma2 family endonuclease
MNVELAPPILEPDDLLRIPDGDRYELIDGHLKEMNMGWEAGSVAVELSTRLSMFCRSGRLGFVGSGGDCGFVCFPHRPRLVRKPDVSFVRRGRFPGDRPPTGHARIAPDLAAEVVSPNDLAEEIEEKVQDYLTAGVPLVWVCYPRARAIHVFRLDGTTARLTDAQELDGETVLPGFGCRVGDLFPPPAEAPSTAEPQAPA